MAAGHHFRRSPELFEFVRSVLHLAGLIVHSTVFVCVLQQHGRTAKLHGAEHLG